MSKTKNVIPYLFLIVFFVLIIAVYNFMHYYVFKNYTVQVYTACDTSKHSCFVADPDIADPTFQSVPYSKVEMTASNIPSCLEEHTCSDFTCDNIVGACFVTYCSELNKEDGETCSIH